MRGPPSRGVNSHLKLESVGFLIKFCFSIVIIFFPDYYDNSGNGDSFFKGMSSRGPPPMKRGPPVRNGGGPPPKRSAMSGPMGRRKYRGKFVVALLL